MRNKKARRRRYSQISRQILVQYLLSVLGLIAGIFACYLLAYSLCTRILWQMDDPLYVFFKALQAFSPALVGVLLILGLIFLTRHFLSKPLGYLDEVIDAAEKLTQPGEEPIALSPPMRDVENELNLVREQALRSAIHAREAEQRKNDLVVYLAHDLKTPLTSVIGYLTLLRDETQISPELREKYTGIALSKAERLEELINEFFDITRFNLTSLALEEETVNLTRMLEQITYEFRPVLQEKNLTWDLQLAPEVYLRCDPDKLERVFDNLLRNAVNYSYQDTAITVCLEQREEHAVIQVKNRGKTIPEEKLSRLFEQFFRLDSSRGSATGGAGLGLAIAKEIVERHGGVIRAWSREEHIVFTVTLPRNCQKIV